MRAAEFEGLTLAELHELARAWETRTRREDFRSGLLALLLVRMFGQPEFPPELADWFPSFESLRPPPMTVEQMEAKLDAVFGALGGRPKE